MKQSLLSLSLAAGLAVSAFAGETETNKPAVPPVTAENKAVTCTISPERNVLASDKPNTALVKVALKGGVIRR